MDGSLTPDWMDISEAKRIDELMAKLEARTDASGAPLPGSARNVEAIKSEINRLARKGHVKNPLKDK